MCNGVSTTRPPSFLPSPSLNLQTVQTPYFRQFPLHVQELFRHIQNPVECSEPEPYSKPWHIQNKRHIQKPGILRTWGILRNLSRAKIIFADYNNFLNMTLLRFLLYEININSLILVQILLLRYLFYVKKHGGWEERRPRTLI